MDGDLLPDGRREVSVLFTDLEGFAALTERLGDERVASLLAEYYAVVGRIVEKHGGVVDKLIGDGVFATFNAVAELENHRVIARRAGEEIIAEISGLTVEGKPLRAAVYAASGPAEVRTFTAGGHTSTTVVGRTVNRAGMAMRSPRYGSVTDTDAK
jgi:class 3 adenylate cyclase